MFRYKIAIFVVLCPDEYFDENIRSCRSTLNTVAVCENTGRFRCEVPGVIGDKGIIFSVGDDFVSLYQTAFFMTSVDI